MPIIRLISFVLRAGANPLHIDLPEYYAFSWYQRGAPTFGRAAVERQLLQAPGKHLVFVRYKPDHEPFAEWVYNEPDLDHAKIIWARETSPSSDQELVASYPGREVWVIDADANPPALTGYH